MPLGDPKHDVQMPVDVSIDRDRINSTDDVASERNCLFQKAADDWGSQYPALWECDGLDVDNPGPTILEREDRLNIGELDLGIDVDVAAERRGPVRDSFPQECGAAFHDWPGCLPPHRRLI